MVTGKNDQRLRVTLRQLEVFSATAREGSTRAAADKVARSQSAASTALADLEKTLGVELFDRVGRRLSLNENGRALLPRAVSLLEQSGELERLFDAEHPAPLRMASSFTIGEYVLPGLIAEWERAHPRNQVRLDIANTREVLQAVADYDVDIGFIEGTGSHPELSVRRWQSDQLVIVAAPGHPLAGRRVSAQRLAEASWILREQGSGTREAADRWLTASLTQVNVKLELGSNEAVKRAVRSGLGLGCISRLAVSEALAQGLLIELSTTLPAMERSLAIVVHKTKRLGSVADDFLHHCFADAPRSRSRRQSP
ncbi:MAG: LysR family transcriptional regulator [Ramlibacter sp.]